MEIISLYIDPFYFETIGFNLIIITLFFFVYTYYYRISDRFLEFRYASGGTLSSKDIKILAKHFPYYRKLSTQLKKQFESHVSYFVYSKKYEDISGVEVPHKKRLLIGAYAAQITFGIDNFKFTQIKRILLHPRPFISKNSGELRKWEIEDNGTIHLSWSDFYLGLNAISEFTPTGIEVMAEAFRIENEIHPSFQLNLDVNQIPLRNSYREIKNQLLFKFDEDNRGKFLTQCLENFFNKPTEFKNQYPKLYKEVDQTLYKNIL